MDAIEANILAKKTKNEKLNTLVKEAAKSKTSLISYLNQKSGTALKATDDKALVKAHRALKKTDTKYATMYKAAAKVTNKKRKRFAKLDQEYNLLLTNLKGDKKKKKK